jgi:MFS transporter, AAHS family, 4-hydroxybenzoate transporter
MYRFGASGRVSGSDDEAASMITMQPIQAVAVSSSRARFRVAWLCTAVLLIEGYDIAAVGYVIPSLVDAWRVPPAAFTSALVASNVGLLFGSLIAGLLGDRLGRKPVLIAGVSAFGIFSLVSAFVASPTQLAVARALTGLGLGGGIPLSIALASDFSPSVARARFVLLATLGIPIGFALAGLLSSLLIGAFGWPAVFVAGGAAPLLLAPLLMFRLPESTVVRAGLPPPDGGIAALFRDGRAPSTALLWSINLLNLLATYFLLLWTPAILHDAGASRSAAIIATTIFSLGVVASPALVAPIVDRLGIERVLAVTLAVGASCILGIGLFDPPFALLVALVFGAGIGVGAQGGINALSGLIYPPTVRATGAGWALGFGRIGGVAGPIFGGALFAHGFSAQQIYCGAAIPVLGAMALMAMLGRVRKRLDVVEAEMKVFRAERSAT